MRSENVTVYMEMTLTRQLIRSKLVWAGLQNLQKALSMQAMLLLKLKKKALKENWLVLK